MTLNTTYTEAVDGSVFKGACLETGEEKTLALAGN
jgi:hypothetical protein